MKLEIRESDGSIPFERVKDNTTGDYIDEPISSEQIAEMVSNVITTLESITEEDDCTYRDEIDAEIAKLYGIESLLK